MFGRFTAALALFLSATIISSDSFAVYGNFDSVEIGPEPWYEVPWVRQYKLNDPAIESMLLRATTVDEFLSALKASSRSEYLTRYIPIWNSTSLQQSFWFCPRLLMYNEDASLVLSVHDCPKFTSERDDVEIAQWNEQQETYEFFSVHYKMNGAPVEQVKMGDKNPAECMRCHRGGISIGAYDPFYFPDNHPDYWRENLDYFTHKIGPNRKHFRRQGGAISVPRYGEFFNLVENAKGYPTKQQWHSNHVEAGKGFGIDSYLDDFNNKLAYRNNRRAVRVLRNLLGEGYSDPLQQDLQNVPQYDELKFAMVGALSFCENFADMMPYRDRGLPKSRPRSDYDIRDLIQSRREGAAILQAPVFEDYFRAEQLHRKIQWRVGESRKMSDIYKRRLSESYYQKTYHGSQTEAVFNLYYVFLNYVNPQKWEYMMKNSDNKQLSGIEKALLHLNVNPIKMAWHPAWSAAHLANEIMQDEDFVGLDKIGDDKRSDYLIAKMGVAPPGHSVYWQEMLLYKPREFQNALSEYRPEQKLFCENLQKRFCEKVQDQVQCTKRGE